VTVRDNEGRLQTLQPRWFHHRKGERLFFCLNQRDEVIAFGNHSSCGDRRWRSLAGTVEEVKETRFTQISVEYGIESYFVEEGKGKAIEAARNARDLQVEVSLRRDGKGLITVLFMDGKEVR
jgi:hypothetical protein